MPKPPILVPCLVVLRTEFNGCGPRRDKSSDGWLGDRAHALTSSDHNPDESGRTPYEDADNVDEVHGLDVDDSGPWLGGFDFDVAVDYVRWRHQTGADSRLQNIIRNGRIASRSWGWTWRPYTGANGHFEHAHFSARYETVHENDTRSWDLKGPFMPSPYFTPADAQSVVDLLMAHKVGTYGTFGGTVQTRMARTDSLTNEQVPNLAVAVDQLAVVVAQIAADVAKIKNLEVCQHEEPKPGP